MPRLVTSENVRVIRQRCFRSFAIALAALDLMLFTACGKTSLPIVSPTGAVRCDQDNRSTAATRRASDVMTDLPAWISGIAGNPAESYGANGNRPLSQYDTDAGGGHAGGGGRVLNAACSQPASGRRAEQSLTFVPTQCWYQARVPGVHNTDVDTFLGCDYAIFDTNYNFTGFGGNRGGAVGVIAGPPQDGAVCQSSPTSVGDTLSPGSGYFTNVTDINAIWNGNKVAGWIYLGADGKEYYQLNFANQAGRSLGIAWGVFNIGLTAPAGYSGFYAYSATMLSTPPGQIPDQSNALYGASVKKCFKGGKSL